MSRISNPKVWYLVVIGAAALMVDSARRLVKKRRETAGLSLPASQTITSPVMPIPARGMPVEQTKYRDSPPLQDEIIPILDTPTANISSQSKPDDLTEINGIGPAYARRLADGGITTFAAIAASTPERLREVARATAMAKPEEWIAQARLK